MKNNRFVFLAKRKNRIVFFIFILLNSLNLFFTNCSQPYSFTLIDQNVTDHISPRSESGGNGEGYNGKLTFITTEYGFYCENKPAPVSVLRRNELGQWLLTVNTAAKCSVTENLIVTDVDYTSGDLFVNYKDNIFKIDNSLPTEPASLENFVEFYSVTNKVNANSKDSKLGDKICADQNGFCSLTAAIDEALVEDKKSVLIKLEPGTYLMDHSTILNSLKNSPTDQNKPTISLLGDSPQNTIIDGNNLVNLFVISDRTIEFLNLSINNGSASGFSVGTAITTANLGSVVVKNVEFKNHNSPSNPVIDVTPGSGDLYFENIILANNTSSAGFSIFSPLKLSIVNSQIISNSNYGVNVYNGSNNILIKNTLIANNKSGVELRKCRLNCIIENSIISHNTNNGLVIDYATNGQSEIKVVGSTIKENSANLVMVYSNTYNYLSLPLRLVDTSIISPALGGKNCTWILDFIGIININSTVDDLSCGF
jgi:hypothetical protein